ncbi:hypothetical protein JCM10295v2_001028 [Rhodotorula toruloides]
MSQSSAKIIGNLLGETWLVGPDSSVPVTAADLVLRRRSENQWEGSLLELKALNSIVTSRIRRSRHEGPDNPYIPLVVTNGSHFFVVIGRIDFIEWRTIASASPA